MSTPPKRKEAPTEPLKRAIGLCVRAIAGHADLDVGFAPGAPEYSAKHVQLPEPSRVPSQREVAVIRGWADSFALTAVKLAQIYPPLPDAMKRDVLPVVAVFVYTMRGPLSVLQSLQ